MGSSVDIGTSFGSPIGRSILIGDLVSIVLSNAVAIAGIILLLLLIGGGISIIIGAGQQNPQQVAQGRAAATAALVGFVVIFGSYWLIQIIETVFGVTILNPGI